MRKQNFTERAATLAGVIRERGELTKTEAMTVLKVGPWQIPAYADYVVNEFAGIRYDGKRFWFVVQSLQTGLKPLEEFTREKER